MSAGAQVLTEQYQRLMEPEEVWDFWEPILDLRDRYIPI